MSRLYENVTRFQNGLCILSNEISIVCLDKRVPMQLTLNSGEYEVHIPRSGKHPTWMIADDNPSWFRCRLAFRRIVEIGKQLETGTSHRVSIDVDYGFQVSHVDCSYKFGDLMWALSTESIKFVSITQSFDSLLRFPTKFYY